MRLNKIYHGYMIVKKLSELAYLLGYRIGIKRRRR